MAVAEVWSGAAKGGGRFSTVADLASAERIRGQGLEHKPRPLAGVTSRAENAIPVVYLPSAHWLHG